MKECFPSVRISSGKSNEFNSKFSHCIKDVHVIYMDPISNKIIKKEA